MEKCRRRAQITRPSEAAGKSAAECPARSDDWSRGQQSDPSAGQGQVRSGQVGSGRVRGVMFSRVRGGRSRGQVRGDECSGQRRCTTEVSETNFHVSMWHFVALLDSAHTEESESFSLYYRNCAHYRREANDLSTKLPCTFRDM